jgi:hypothetical protein
MLLVLIHKSNDTLKTRHDHCFLKETYFAGKDKHRLKMKRWEKIFQENGA